MSERLQANSGEVRNPKRYSGEGGFVVYILFVLIIRVVRSAGEHMYLQFQLISC